MKFIDANWIYTVELSGEDIYRLNQVLDYATRCKNKKVKNYAHLLLKDLAGRQPEEVEPLEKEVLFGQCT
jgi:hypothetical protein